MGLFFLAIKNQLSHFLQMCLCLRTVIMVGRTRPEGFLVELNLFRSDDSWAIT